MQTLSEIVQLLIDGSETEKSDEIVDKVFIYLHVIRAPEEIHEDKKNNLGDYSPLYSTVKK